MKEPTGAQWRDLHVEFCAVEPWEVLDDTDLIVMEHPSREYMGYCRVMGGSGLELPAWTADQGGLRPAVAAGPGRLEGQRRGGNGV